jgi:hypothetical protein
LGRFIASVDRGFGDFGGSRGLDRVLRSCATARGFAWWG